MKTKPPTQKIHSLPELYWQTNTQTLSFAAAAAAAAAVGAGVAVVPKRLAVAAAGAAAAAAAAADVVGGCTAAFGVEVACGSASRNAGFAAAN